MCSRPGDLQSHRVLAAIPPEQRDLFFPGPAQVGDQNHWSWVDPRSLTAEAWPALLRREHPDVLVACWATPRVPDEAIAPRGGSVSYVCNVAGSVRHLVTREQIAAGLYVTNWGTLAAPMVAEHALLLTLATLRNLPSWPSPYARAARDGLQRYESHTLYGKRVGIMGFGAIARALIPLLQPFRPRIRAFSFGVSAQMITAGGAEPAASLESLFGESDVLVCCESLTPYTQEVVGRALLQLLPRDGVFVNVGRGAIVKQEDLVAVAQERRLRTGLDVFVPDPLPEDSPLWTLPSAVLSPHIGGPTQDGCPDCGRWAEANVHRFLAGEVPHGVITLDVFDRST